MSSTTQTQLTADELLRLPENGMRRELVYGEVVETMPPGMLHGMIVIALGTLLKIWAKSGKTGYVGTELGFVLEHDPDLVRSPDVVFVSVARLPAAGVPAGFGDLAPDLAVEVVSPGDTAAEVREKVRQYLAAGTPLVWVVYPGSREVLAHTPDGRAQTFGPDDTLDAPEVLPGFSCRVAEIFE